jgi:hypothetical protein
MVVVIVGTDMLPDCCQKPRRIRKFSPRGLARFLADAHML